MATAQVLVSRGARVVLTELPERLKEAEEAAAALGGYAAALDVRDAAESARCVQEVVEREGKLDVLVNNAGVAVRKAALELTPDDWDRVFDTNLRGAFFLAQAAGSAMIAQGSGRVINVASIFGLVGGVNRAAYASSKAGLVNLTRCLALEWAASNVQVNAVAPNFVVTPMTREFLDNPSTSEWILGRTATGRLAEPNDVAETIAFLAGPAPSYITGVTLPVDGGWVAA